MALGDEQYFKVLKHAGEYDCSRVSLRPEAEISRLCTKKPPLTREVVQHTLIDRRCSESRGEHTSISLVSEYQNCNAIIMFQCYYVSVSFLPQ